MESKVDCEVEIHGIGKYIHIGKVIGEETNKWIVESYESKKLYKFNKRTLLGEAVNVKRPKVLGIVFIN